MIHRVETRKRGTFCTSCRKPISKNTPYFRSQYWETRSIGPTWGRNFCKSCIVRAAIQLLFPWFFNIPNRNDRDIKSAKAALRCPIEEVTT